MAILSSTLKIRELIILTVQKIGTPYLFLYALAFNLVLVLTFAFLRGEYAYMINANILSFDSRTEELLIVVVFAPFLETILYQYFLIFITLFITEKLLKKESALLSIILPAIYFSSSHLPDYMYILYALLGALSMNLFYVIVKYRMQRAILYTTIVHELCNLFVLGLRHI